MRIKLPVLLIVMLLIASATAQDTPKPEAAAFVKTAAPIAPAAKTVDLKSVKKVFIEPMPNDLDQYIKVEFQKQLKGKVSVVLAKEDADGIIAGTGEWQKGTGAAITGRYLGLHDTATAAISMVSNDGKTLLWSGEAGDRSLMFGVMKRGGPRKVADRIVHKLKSDMGY